MKRKLIYFGGIVVVVIGLVAIIGVRRHATSGVENELPNAMSNYQKTFKLDTSTPVFPDGQTTNPLSKTNH